MFADQAYSLHSLALMASVIICLLCSAVLLALLGAKLYKQPLFWMAAAMLLSLTVFSVVRFLLLIAPAQTIYDLIKKLQTAAGVMWVAVSLMIFIALIIKKHSVSIIFGMAVIVFINAAGAAAVLKTDPVSIADFYPAVSYFAFCGFCLLHSRTLFPELTGLSPEAFLNDSSDLILVFDRRGRLMKASYNAMEVFHLSETMTLQEFNSVLKGLAAVHEDKTIELAALSGKRYYQQSETAVTKRSGALLATVVMFSDVTDMTVLKSELKDRNEELKMQGEKLKEYIKTVEKLEAEEQKEMVVREIQQAIGQKMEDLAQEMESGEASQNLPQIIESCRSIISGVRLALSGLAKTEKGGKSDD